MPWLLVPVLPLLLFGAQVHPSISLYLPYLFIPVTALIGRRFGAPGIVVVGLGGILALGPTVSLSWLYFGGVPAVYLIGLCVCWAATQPAPLAALTGKGVLWRHPVWFAGLLILLPLSFGFGRWEMADVVEAEFQFSMLPLLIFALFLSGLAGFGAVRAMGGLAVAAVAGILIRALEIDVAASLALRGDEFFLRYRLDDLATFATAAAAFYAGRHVANPLESGNPWSHRYPMAAFLVILALLPILGGQLLPPWPPMADYFGVYGQYAALPLAAFMAGIGAGFVGLGFVVGCTVTLILAGNLAAYYVTERGLWLDLEQPCIALAFAWLGIRLGDLKLERHRPWPGGRWYLYTGLVLLLLPALFSRDELLNLIMPFLTAVAAALLAALVACIRQRLAVAGITLTGEGWLKLALVVAVVVGLANAGPIFDGVVDIAGQYDVPPQIALPAILLLLHLPLAFLARMLAEIWPKIAGDLRNIVAYWRD